MKRNFLIPLICALGLAGCTAPSTTQLSRQDLLRQLSRMREMDSKYEEIRTYASLATLLGVDVPESQAKELEEHSEIYWLHYQAANIAIANGDLKSYEAHMLVSRVEMDAIEAILKRIASEFSLDPGDKPESGGFNTPTTTL